MMAVCICPSRCLALWGRAVWYLRAPFFWGDWQGQSSLWSHIDYFCLHCFSFSPFCLIYCNYLEESIRILPRAKTAYCLIFQSSSWLFIVIIKYLTESYCICWNALQAWIVKIRRGPMIQCLEISSTPRTVRSWKKLILDLYKSKYWGILRHSCKRGGDPLFITSFATCGSL